MKNFPITIKEDLIVDEENMKGKTVWVSRSCAVAGFVFMYLDGIYYILAGKRGKGCPDYQGYWCCPCGYVDYGETTEKAIRREIHEETGFKCPFCLTLCGVNDAPTENKQNITLRYGIILDGLFFDTLPELTNANSEPDEVDELHWIPLEDIGKFRWAFGYEKVIFDVFTKLIIKGHENI